MGSKKLMIIDCDCGVDDARAILMALSNYATQKSWKVLAITTACGNVQLDYVNENVLKVLNLCEKFDISVYQGSQINMSGRKLEPELFHGIDGLGDAGHEFSCGNLKVQEENAVVKLTELAKQYKGQITLVALAPLTNVAMAQRLDPDFTKNLKEIVVLGGTINGEGNKTAAAEFNFYVDPEAADIVLKESSCPITIVPWETCYSQQNFMPWGDYDDWLKIKTPKAHFVRRIGESRRTTQWNTPGEEYYYCCDSVAMAVAIETECIKKSIKCHARVETQSELCRGFMVADKRISCPNKPNVTVVVELNTKKVRELSTDMLH